MYDCQQLLATLFMAEEQDRIWLERRVGDRCLTPYCSPFYFFEGGESLWIWNILSRLASQQTPGIHLSLCPIVSCNEVLLHGSWGFEPRSSHLHAIALPTEPYIPIITLWNRAGFPQPSYIVRSPHSLPQSPPERPQGPLHYLYPIALSCEAWLREEAERILISL